MTEERSNQKQAGSEIKTFSVPFPLKKNERNLTISTYTPSKLSKEQLINQAVKFHARGDISKAQKYYQYCIKQGFNDYRVFANYGLLLKNLGKLKQAEINTRKAIELNPRSEGSHCNLATILLDLGNRQEAEKYLRKAIKLKPDFADAYSNLGSILKDLGKLKEAEISVRKAIDIKPDFADAYANLGTILYEYGELKEAELLQRKAIKINPNFVNAYSNLGNILRDAGKLDEAEICTRKAIQIAPDSAYAHLNLGCILKDLDKLQEAEISIRKAIKIKPDYAEAYNNLGTILRDHGNLQEAEISYRKAIKLNPKSASANHGLSHVLLKAKKFKEAWNLYEWRWKVKSIKGSIGKKLDSSKPEWARNNRGRVLLWPEQGIGDILLFSSLIPELLNEVDLLIFQVDKRLIPIFKRSFDKKIIYIDENDFLAEENYDYQIPIGSLPKIFRNTKESFDKVQKKYLKADENKTSIYTNKIKDNKFTKIIGISWRSESKVNNKSLSLEEFMLAIYSPKICFVNLQYGDTKNEIINLKTKYRIQIYEIEEVDNFNDLDGLASVINACDEVVSIDNVTLHLAGSIGKKTNILLSYKCHWYHGIDDKKSYWFPTVNFFRQKKLNEWNLPLKEIKNEIKVNN